MTEAYLGEIKLCSFNYPPKGWAFCDGKLLTISKNQALYTLLGTRYGGDGITTFALPDLRGRVPIHYGQQFKFGESGGEEKHKLTISEMPRHTHSVYASNSAANQGSPSNNFWAGETGVSPFSNKFDTQMANGAVDFSGSDQPHENMSPFLVLNFLIAIEGQFPSAN